MGLVSLDISIWCKRNAPLGLLSDFNPFNATRCVVEVEGVDFWQRDFSLSPSENEEVPDCDFIAEE